MAELMRYKSCDYIILLRPHFASRLILALLLALQKQSVMLQIAYKKEYVTQAWHLPRAKSSL
jgi:hypothetical protein